MQKEKYVTEVTAVIANDGRGVIVIQWPDGQQQLVERDEALRLFVTGLGAVSALYRTPEEFKTCVDLARAEAIPLEHSRRAH